MSSRRLLSITMLLIRIAIGIVLFMAGAGKVFGWFGGYGLDATIPFYTALGIPAWLGYVSMYTELLGGLLIIIGFLTRLVAVAVFVNMLVATIVSWPMGFLAGAAFPAILMVNALAVFVGGPMVYSVDYLLWHRRR